MMTIKKKKAATRRKPPRKAASALPPPVPAEGVAVPVPADAVLVPAPVLTVKQRRFWSVVETTTLIGGGFFLFGLGIFGAWLTTDKVHGWEKWAFGFAMVSMIFGAHLMSSAPTERALNAIGRTAGRVIPLARKTDTAEQKAKDSQ